jgi:Domain of Unknown Function (DUF1080)
VEPGSDAIGKKIKSMLKKYLLKTTGIAVAIIACISLSFTSNKMENEEGKWISLFDGKTFNGWHGFNKTGPIQNWAIEEGAMVCLGAAADAHGGDIVTDADYENFELKWEWKISKAGNSGVMYHVIEDAKYSAPYQTGPEYQMIDDVGFPEKLEDWQQTGADYAMHVANDKKKLQPVGEWNSSKIVFNKGHVEHWLNGEKIVEFQAWDAEWTKKKTEGKWKDYPGYGSAKTGRIALQDHGNKAYFKNIMIKAL